MSSLVIPTVKSPKKHKMYNSPQLMWFQDLHPENYCITEKQCEITIYTKIQTAKLNPPIWRIYLWSLSLCCWRWRLLKHCHRLSHSTDSCSKGGWEVINKAGKLSEECVRHVKIRNVEGHWKAAERRIKSAISKGTVMPDLLLSNLISL